MNIQEYYKMDKILKTKDITLPKDDMNFKIGDFICYQKPLSGNTNFCTFCRDNKPILYGIPRMLGFDKIGYRDSVSFYQSYGNEIRSSSLSYERLINCINSFPDKKDN